MPFKIVDPNEECSCGDDCECDGRCSCGKEKPLSEKEVEAIEEVFGKMGTASKDPTKVIEWLGKNISKTEIVGAMKRFEEFSKRGGKIKPSGGI